MAPSAKEPGGADHPANPKTRRENLRHALQVYGMWVRGGFGRRLVDGKVAIRIVEHHQEVVPRGENEQLVASVSAQGCAGWVVEVGNHINELGSDAGTELFCHLLHHEALDIDVDGGESGARTAKRLEGAEIVGVADNHRVARIEQHLAQEMERLLRTGRHKNMFDVGRRWGARHDCFAKSCVSRGKSVLKGIGVTVEDALSRERGHLFAWESVGVGKASRE
jgi:hypothetical protein